MGFELGKLETDRAGSLTRYKFGHTRLTLLMLIVYKYGSRFSDVILRSPSHFVIIIGSC